MIIDSSENHINQDLNLKKTSYLNTEYLGFLINDSSIIDNNLRKSD